MSDRLDGLYTMYNMLLEARFVRSLVEKLKLAEEELLAQWQKREREYSELVEILQGQLSGENIPFLSLEEWHQKMEREYHETCS